MATSEAKILVGNGVKFNGEVGADVAFSFEGTSATAGQVSAQYDIGASPRAYLWMWHAEVVWQATPTQYQTADFYAAGAYDGDSTMIWGDPGASDAALGDVDMVRNMLPIGSVVVEDAATTKMVGGGIFEWPHRYISIVGINSDSSAAINATDSNFLFFLQPYTIQGQAT